MRQSKFSMEPFGSRVFDGYALNEDWNGWACPYFTYDEALKIAEAQKTVGGEAWYDNETDQFVFILQGEEEAFGPVDIDGVKLYPIGNGAWIWEEVEPE